MESGLAGRGSTSSVVLLGTDADWQHRLASALQLEQFAIHHASDWPEALSVAATVEAHALVVAEADFAPDSLRDLALADALPQLPTFVVCAQVSDCVAFLERRGDMVQGVFAADEDARLVSSVRAWTREVRVRQAESSRRKHAEGSTRRLLAAMHSIAILIDADGAIMGLNEAAQKAFGVDEFDVMALSLVDCDMGWQDPSVASAIVATAEARTPRRFDDVVVHHPTRGARVLGLTVTPLVARQRCEGLVILGRDLTDDKRQQSMQMQRRKLQALGQLAAGVAHEINTPLQCVSDSLHFLAQANERLLALCDTQQDLLVDTADQDAQLRRVLKRARLPYVREQAPGAASTGADSLQRVVAVVEALRGVAHVDSQPVSPVCLNQALRDVVTLSQPSWKSLCEVEFDLAAALPDVVCRGGEIKQVLVALLTNAIQAIEACERAEPGRILLRSRRDAGGVCVEIEDNGCGIDASISERVFEPFFTTRDVGQGEGQGLATAHTVIVDHHGGALSHAPAPGGGTVLRLVLPIELAGQGVLRPDVA